MELRGLEAPTGHLIVMWLGLVIRVWSVAALGRAFRTTVEVVAGQTVVSHGPYRRVRHPSYAGQLLIFSGLSLAVDNWLALTILMMLPASVRECSRSWTAATAAAR
jgi:protein-S-isoprenylcysteine O-methyltransferase Ste14